MSEKNITDKEEFIKIVGILSFSDVHPTDCKYITNFIIDLAKENQQLKESNKNQKDIFLKETRRKEKQYINRITRKNKDICELREQLDLYKSVLDEIRECVKGNYVIDNPVKFKNDIWDILDKVKE